MTRSQETAASRRALILQSITLALLPLIPHIITSLLRLQQHRILMAQSTQPTPAALSQKAPRAPRLPPNQRRPRKQNAGSGKIAAPWDDAELALIADLLHQMVVLGGIGSIQESHYKSIAEHLQAHEDWGSKRKDVTPSQVKNAWSKAKQMYFFFERATEKRSGTGGRPGSLIYTTPDEIKKWNDFKVKLNAADSRIIERWEGKTWPPYFKIKEILTGRTATGDYAYHPGQKPSEEPTEADISNEVDFDADDLEDEEQVTVESLGSISEQASAISAADPTVAASVPLMNALSDFTSTLLTNTTVSSLPTATPTLIAGTTAASTPIVGTIAASPVSLSNPTPTISISASTLAPTIPIPISAPTSTIRTSAPAPAPTPTTRISAPAPTTRTSALAPALTTRTSAPTPTIPTPTSTVSTPAIQATAISTPVAGVATLPVFSNPASHSTVTSNTSVYDITMTESQLVPSTSNTGTAPPSVASSRKRRKLHDGSSALASSVSSRRFGTAPVEPAVMGDNAVVMAVNNLTTTVQMLTTQQNVERIEENDLQGKTYDRIEALVWNKEFVELSDPERATLSIYYANNPRAADSLLSPSAGQHLSRVMSIFRRILEIESRH